MPRESSRGVRVFSVDTERIRGDLGRTVETRYLPDANVLAVVLFGSFARGDAVPGSDIDLLVVLERDARKCRDRIPDYLPHEFSVGVDVIPWTRAELEDRVARGDRFALAILKEGEVLLDRDDVFGAIRRRG